MFVQYTLFLYCFFSYFCTIIWVEVRVDWKLLVTFDDGFCVCYDVKDDIDTIDDFKSLTTEIGLWPLAQLDSSRTCISWKERIDLPSDTIYEYGVPILE